MEEIEGGWRARDLGVDGVGERPQQHKGLAVGHAGRGLNAIVEGGLGSIRHRHRPCDVRGWWDGKFLADQVEKCRDKIKRKGGSFEAGTHRPGADASRCS